MEEVLNLNQNLLFVKLAGLTALSLLGFIFICFFYAMKQKRADLADVAWGGGFVVVAWTSFFLSKFSYIGFIVALLVSLWGIRLAAHIYFRNRCQEIDFRYQDMTKKWGSHFNWHLFFNIFLLQGFFLYIIALPILWVHIQSDLIFSSTIKMSLLLWIVGFCIETVGDYQLSLFKKDPLNKGKILQTGLFSFVRHPNYLGEIIQWWGIWWLVANVPLGLFFIVSPCLITFLIVKVSGVPLLEEKMKKNPEFESWAKKTPALFPFSLINGGVYWTSWFAFIYFGINGDLTALFLGMSCFISQIFMFYKWDHSNFLISISLAICAFFLGFFQETILIYFGVLSYTHTSLFPPFWILILYASFSFTLNSSLAFLNKHLFLAFILGGGGAVLSYLSGEEMGVSLHVFYPYIPFLFISWGSFLVFLVLINKKLLSLIKLK